MNVLLCGPITGDDAVDYEIFKSFEDDLSGIGGISVINPMRNLEAYRKKFSKPDGLRGLKVGEDGLEWLNDITFMLNALTVSDAILLLPGWNSAADSIIVCLAAQALNIDMVYFDEAGDLCRQRINLVTESSFDNEEIETTEWNDRRRPPIISDRQYRAKTRQWRAQDHEARDQKNSASASPVDEEVAKWFKRQTADINVQKRREK